MIYGVLTTDAETEVAIQCGGCGNKANEGFNLDTAIEEEFSFLEMLFMGITNATINRCCVDKFRNECSRRNFEFEITPSPPDEILNAFSDVGEIPGNLSKNISYNHEFYHVKTRDGVVIWGFLWDYDDTSFELQNCRRLDATNNWVRTGDNENGCFRVIIPTGAIESIEPAPYVKKDDSDYRFRPFVGDK